MITGPSPKFHGTQDILLLGGEDELGADRVQVLGVSALSMQGVL